jgi:hypothetical protein
MEQELGIVINFPFRLDLDTLSEGIEEIVYLCQGHTDKIIAVADKRTIEQAPSDAKENSFFKSLVDLDTKAIPKLVQVYSVDTCDRWLGGFGWALENKGWESVKHILLLPGDFKIACDTKSTIEELIRETSDDKYEMVVGTIKSELLSSKQLIDTYATYALMLVWFPQDAKTLVQHGILKPRSEFFGLSRRLLEYTMSKRWFPYAQTLVILLRYLWWRRENLKLRPIHNVPISVGPEAGARDLKGAITQLERIERVLRFLWREKMSEENQLDMREYELIDSRSAAARKLAVNVFKTLIERS